MNIPGPINARGKILYNLLPAAGHYKEATILYISDFHGQLTPLSQTADNVAGGARQPEFWHRRGSLPETLARSVSRRSQDGEFHHPLRR